MKEVNNFAFTFENDCELVHLIKMLFNGNEGNQDLCSGIQFD